MKRFLCALLAVALIAGFALAADVELNTTITDISFSLDKNGREYARIIIQEPRQSGSIKYVKSLPVMVFGEEMVAQAKALKKGDTLHCIATLGEYQNRESYTLLAFAQ